MINNGIIIEPERGRIRIARYIDDYLGKPDYLAFIADNGVLCLCEGDNSDNGWGRVCRGNTVDINCKGITDWLVKGYGLEPTGKIIFEISDLGGATSIPYVNIHIDKPFTEPAA